MVANKMDLAAVRGRMGSRDYYVVMFPLGLVPRYFKFHDWSEMPPEQRAQRQLSEKRVPEIARYIIEHEDDWVFSSLTASFDAEEEFVPSELDPNLGVLRLPLTAEFLLNDGQHRQAALERALAENRMLEQQSISVVLFPMEDLARSQQVFSDLNRTVHKTSRSLDILYDHRDPLNALTITVADAVPVFKDRVEKDRVSVAQKSAKFVALSALYDANKALVGGFKEEATEEELARGEVRAIDFWTAVGKAIPQWNQVRTGELRPAEVRAEYVNAHAVAFWALGTAGRVLLEKYPDEASWKARLAHLSDIDWRKTNDDWQGICMLGTDIITRRQTREATAKYIQWKLGLIDERPGKVLGAGSASGGPISFPDLLARAGGSAEALFSDVVESDEADAALASVRALATHIGLADADDAEFRTAVGHWSQGTRILSPFRDALVRADDPAAHSGTSGIPVG
jgi:DNA sulfur modification protein DndB